MALNLVPLDFHLNQRKAKNVSNPFWISIFDFDSNFRRQFSPILNDPLIRETQKIICLNRIVKIFIAGNTFVAEGLDYKNVRTWELSEKTPKATFFVIYNK